MELHLDSIGEAPRPDWLVAAVAGFAAGALLMMVELFWASLFAGDPWQTSHEIAAIILGPQALESSSFGFGVVIAALVTHYVLGIIFGLILGFLMAVLRVDETAGRALLAGVVFGVLLYLLDFYVMSAAFSWLAQMRGLNNLIAHLIFGVAAAFLYWGLHRRSAAR